MPKAGNTSGHRTCVHFLFEVQRWYVQCPWCTMVLCHY